MPARQKWTILQEPGFVCQAKFNINQCTIVHSVHGTAVDRHFGVKFPPPFGGISHRVEAPEWTTREY